VKSYFGLRKIELKKDSAGRARIHLNGRYTYNLGVVDQGFWPDGLYAAPSDAALRFDVQAVKALGFNTVRKHIKIEPERWYYHCDQLGLLVWQDMPSSSNDTPQARAQFERELEENLAQLHNHPCITTWVLFNEGWGAYDQERLALWIKHTDPSRLVNGHSGPFDQLRDAQWVRRREPLFLLQPLGGAGLPLEDIFATQYQAPPEWMLGDLADVHFYPGPRMFPAQADIASVTGEHGSFGVHVEGHVWDELNPVGRGVGASGMTPQQMLAAYAASIEKLKALEQQGLSGSDYFELYDVESEHQGFLTYDRALTKVPVTEIARLNAQIVPRAKNYEKATKGFLAERADWTPESQRYRSLVKELRNGRRDMSFLRRLALMALRLSDRAQAAEASKELMVRAPQPYTREVWETIAAITQSSQDPGFELLRTHGDELDVVLGAQAAQKKILDIIGRELIVPYFQEQKRKIGWKDFETLVAKRHGALGREAVLGARMMDDLLKENWAGFANSFVRYFETAICRSPYSLHSLSYRVLKHVNDPQAIDTAIRVMSWQITAKREWPVFGRYDPIELDTYANLLYKAGRNVEALEWQRRAVALSGGRDCEVVENLERMIRETPALTSSRRERV
jgi:hypothetical protein